MTQKISLIATLLAIVACGASFAAPAQAGTCQPVKAKGKVTQASTNCGPVADGYKCKISAVVCPK